MNYREIVMQWIAEYQPDLIKDEEKRRTLYQSLKFEEEKELFYAQRRWDMVECYDALCDIMRVIQGTKFYGYEEEELIKYILKLDFYNMDCFNECFEEVRKSNWTKSKKKMKSGKIIKGNNYKPPHLLTIIAKYHDLHYTCNHDY